MALILKNVTTLSTPPAPKKFVYAEWYQKNKSRLSETRKKRYQEDENYRNAIKERSKTQRKRPDVPQDEYTINLQQLAANLGLSIWTLREWRKKNYFPEPVHRLGRLWFSPAQAQWIQRLKDFFFSKGLRLKKNDRKELDQLVTLVYAYWQQKG
jgi:predicted DNA-binding transcriptional regulator AlpA